MTENIINEEEDEGIHHIIALADATNVYWYDPITRSKPQILLANQVNVNGIAVDGQRKYLFISQIDAANAKGTVSKYKLFTNFTNTTNPVVNVDTKEAA